MGFFTKLFGRAEGGSEAVYRNGDRVPCEACNQTLKVKYFPRGKIITGGPAAIKGIALVCQHCGFITCIDCAMKPMGGVMQACPSCKKPLGPTTFTEGVDVPKKPTASETHAASQSNDVSFSCPHCGQHITCDKSGVGSQVECPTCKESITIPGGETPPRPSVPKPDESWTPVNPQVSSRMPFAALEHIFIFTSGDGKSLMKSKLVTGMLQDAACKPLSSMLGKIPMDVIARSDVGAKVIRDGSIPDVAWTAMSAIKPDIAREARNGEYRTCVRPFPAETNEVVALFLLYNKQKM